jgi:hypothetical protein
MNFIITVSKRGNSSTGRRPRGGRDTQMRNGNIIADLVGSTRQLGTTTGNAGPRKWLGALNEGTQEDGIDRSR